MNVLFEDDFISFDQTRWFTYTNGYCYGRTIFGGIPQVVTESNNSILRLRAFNYNGGFCNGQSYPFQGTEIMTNSTFGPPSTGGVEFQGRLRVTRSTHGTVFGFFPYIDTGAPPYPQDEIDFEFLGTPRFLYSTLWLNTWNNGVQNHTETTVSGLNFGGWNVYKVRWFNGRLDWFVNDTLVRTETNSAYIPNQALRLHLNAWIPDANFAEAYNPNFPASPPNPQAFFHWDVDAVKVSAVANTTPLITVTNPVSNTRAVTSLPSISGTAAVSPLVGGTLQRVEFELTRYIVQLPTARIESWNGTAWVTQENRLSTTLNGKTWTRTTGLPSGANLSPSTNYH